MKINKKHILVFFLSLFFICIIILIFSANNKQDDIDITINGTYQNNLNTFNSLVFDKESMTYYNYGESEKSEGSYEKKEKNTYILLTGSLKGRKVLVQKGEIKVINNNDIEVFKKISNLPTIIHND